MSYNAAIRIMGSKSGLLGAIAAISGIGAAAPGVRTAALKWRATNDDDEHNARYSPMNRIKASRSHLKV